jgi:type I restriction enzyme M protein
MTQEQIKQLEKDLWESADGLRANSKLTAAEYKDPLLGLVLLRFAQNRYEDAKIVVEKNLPINPRTKQKREATKDDYAAAGAILLPDKAKYDYLAVLPEDENMAEAINNAMKLIEAEYKELEGILPKNYQEFEEKLLRDLVRLFNKDAIKNARGDVFGRIYEFFLMKFSMQGAGAQEGGEFFTPPSLVNLIVNFIQPNHGIIHDPACGSGGMFVQTAHFIQDHENKSVNESITVYGTELKSNNARLAKMNLAIHGIEGTIIESNTFYNNPHNLTGKCDFVMANPPFNVDKVDAKNKFLTEDDRLPFGAPLTGNGTIGNGNYLWIQYFHSYLNKQGRAGFVMASSATDAGNAEKLIRRKLVDTGDVDIIVSVSNNFFYTRSLPCHLWFFDKGKTNGNKDKILMIDARNVYRVVNTTINDFSAGQIINLSCIVQLYRGNANAVTEAVAGQKSNIGECFELASVHYKDLAIAFKKLAGELGKQEIEIPITIEFAGIDKPQNATEILDKFETPAPKALELIKTLENEIAGINEQVNQKEQDKKEATARLKPLKESLNRLSKPIKEYQQQLAETIKELKQAIGDWKALLEYFPENDYRDVEGLCKIVNLDEVKEQDYSLTPGRYVGVALTIDHNFDYKARLLEIQSELSSLNSEAEQLSKTIANNLMELI